MKILMHMCCADCALFPITFFKEKGIETDGLYYKKCAHEVDLTEKHEDDIKKLSEKHHINVFVYPEVNLDSIDVQEDVSLDEIRIKKTFELGKELGYDAITTSLLVSPSFVYERIVEIGLKYSEFFEIPFYYKEFGIKQA